MSNYTNGADALFALNQTNEGNSNQNTAEFTSFKSGTSYKVKAIALDAVQLAYGYGNFNKGVHSFVAKNPSTRDASGKVIANHTPWDKAAEYHKKKSKAFQDAESTKAYAYQGKPRFAMAFVNLADGKVIIIDLSKAQAQGVAATLKKYENKLGKLAFELSKEGSSTATKVSLTPIIDMEEDLTDVERANFAKDITFTHDQFSGIWFEMDEAGQIDALKRCGFDVSLIGYGNPSETTSATEEPKEDVAEDDLPF